LGLLAKLAVVGHAIEFTIPLQEVTDHGLTTTTGVSVVFAGGEPEIAGQAWLDSGYSKPEFLLAG
jgi:hypothetical protein